MNFIQKSTTGEENEQPPTVAPLLSSSSSYHLQTFFSPPLYHGEPSSDQKEAGGWMMVEREHMFDKVVTPSDVGKLNRLVIPKQHAERYFPLDSSTNYKGLLLNFEDRNGKLWRFQYSYWNSSQSYVMTKGWSRFVKEKRLDAGDVVSFQRGVGVTAKDRLFIDWRRRVNPSNNQPHQLSSSSDLSYLFHNHNFIHPWNPLVLQSLPARSNPDFSYNPNGSSSRSVYFRPPQQQFKMTERSELGLGFDPPPPAVDHGKGSGKRLRLFGVNMDCVLSEDADDQDYGRPSELTADTTVAGCSNVNSLTPLSSSSFSTIPYLQLTPAYGGEIEYNQSRMLSASSDHDFNIMSKSAVSNISLDLKMSYTDGEI